MKAKRAPKRDLFAELSEGMTALAEARQGKRTLRAHGATLGQPEKSNRRKSSIHAALRAECE